MIDCVSGAVFSRVDGRDAVWSGPFVLPFIGCLASGFCGVEVVWFRCEESGLCRLPIHDGIVNLIVERCAMVRGAVCLI